MAKLIMNNTTVFLGMGSLSGFVGLYLLMILGIILGAWLISVDRVSTIATGVVIMTGVVVLFVSTVTV